MVPARRRRLGARRRHPAVDFLRPGIELPLQREQLPRHVRGLREQRVDERPQVFDERALRPGQLLNHRDYRGAVRARLMDRRGVRPEFGGVGRHR